MVSIDQLREALAEEAEGRSDEDLEVLRGLLYLLAEEAVESIEKDQQDRAA